MTENRKRAEELLSQYSTIKKTLTIMDEQMFAISSLLRELKREEDLQDGLSQERVGEYHEGLVKKMTSLRVRKNLLKLRMSMIEGIVNSLKPNEREVIKRFYFSESYHRASDDLMEKLSVEKTQVYRLRRSALKKIGEVMDNFECDMSLPHELRE